MNRKTQAVVEELKRTPKGRLNYDPHWSPNKSGSLEYQLDIVIPVHHEGKSPTILSSLGYEVFVPDITSQSTEQSSGTEHQDQHGSPTISIEQSLSTGVFSNDSKKLTELISKRTKEEKLRVNDIKDVRNSKFKSLESHNNCYNAHDENKTESEDHTGNFNPASTFQENRGEGEPDITTDELPEPLDLHNIQARSNAKMAAVRRKEMFKNGLKHIQKEFQETLVDVDEESNQRYIEDVVYLEESLKQLNEESQLKKDTLKKVHGLRTDSVSKTVSRVNAVKKEIAEQHRREAEEKQLKVKMLKTLEALSQQARLLCTNTLAIIKQCTQKQYLPQDVVQITSAASAEFTMLLNVAAKAYQEQDGLEDALRRVAPSVKKLEEIHDKAKEVIAQAEKRAEQERQKVINQQNTSTATISITPSAPPGQPVPSTAQQTHNTSNISSAASSSSSSVNNPSQRAAFQSSLFVSPMALKEYERLVKFQETVSASFCNLTLSTAAKEKKQFRFELNKAINTPINAISDQSPKHLMDKIERLSSVLNGKTVEVSGKQINATMDPEGMSFCKDHLAKKLVLQGAQQISSSFKSAFPFAAVALGIWAQFPDVGELILAYFYLKCPYLVPYYIPRKDGQSTADYCKLLGYEVSGQDVESEDKYLKKLSGIVRLYAAIVQSSVPPKLAAAAHPHGIHNGWTWFARVVNLEPRPTVTATIIYDFLEVAGHALMKQYGQQFQKLLRGLCNNFVPKIEQVTPADQRGPVMRLKSFLEKCIKAGKIPEPEGYLPTRWWSRRVSI